MLALISAVDAASPHTPELQMGLCHTDFPLVLLKIKKKKEKKGERNQVALCSFLFPSGTRFGSKYLIYRQTTLGVGNCTLHLGGKMLLAVRPSRQTPEMQGKVFMQPTVSLGS